MELDSVEDAEADLRELMAVMTRDAKDEIKRHDDEIVAVVRALGGSIGKYRRERQKGIRAIVAEVYFPPRVTARGETSTWADPRIRARPDVQRCRRPRLEL